MKKLLSVFLLLALLLSAVPAGAEGVVNVYNWEDYHFNDTDGFFIAIFERKGE